MSLSIVNTPWVPDYYNVIGHLSGFKLKLKILLESSKLSLFSKFNRKTFNQKYFNLIQSTLKGFSSFEVYPLKLNIYSKLMKH